MHIRPIRWKSLLTQWTISLGTGILATLLTRGRMDIDSYLQQPPLSPPAIVFPIVWTILYLMMGTAAYLVIQAPSPNRKPGLFLYYLQLLFNFLWSLIFFLWGWYLVAFVWLILLLLLILATTVLFAPASKCAALLMIPYILWVSFAGYLNLGIYFLNQ